MEGSAHRRLRLVLDAYVVVAGLLSADAMEAMLREQLRRRAGKALQSMWQRMPQDELTPEIEQEIVEEVRKVRAEQRMRGAS